MATTPAPKVDLRLQIRPIVYCQPDSTPEERRERLATIKRNLADTGHTIQWSNVSYITSERQINNAIKKMYQHYVFDEFRIVHADGTPYIPSKKGTTNEDLN